MSGPADARRRRTRQALIRAGETLLADRPVDAIAVDDIVREAGVAKGSFFNHFSDKSALALAVATEVRLRMEQRVGAVNAGVGDPEERLVRGVCAFIHPLNAGLRGDLEAGLASGQFRAPGLEPAILMVSGVCQILLSSVLDGPRCVLQDQRLASGTLTLLLIGLGLPTDRAVRQAQDAAEDLIREVAAT